MKWFVLLVVVGGSAFGVYKFREHRIKIEMRERMRDQLRGLRNRVTIARSAHRGVPKTIEGVLEIPRLWDERLRGPHAPNRRVIVVKTRVSLSDSGTWAYIYNKKHPQHGGVYIDCSHADYRGKIWSTY